MSGTYVGLAGVNFIWGDYRQVVVDSSVLASDTLAPSRI